MIIIFFWSVIVVFSTKTHKTLTPLACELHILFLIVLNYLRIVPNRSIHSILGHPDIDLCFFPYFWFLLRDLIVNISIRSIIIISGKFKIWQQYFNKMTPILWMETLLICVKQFLKFEAQIFQEKKSIAEHENEPDYR